MQAAEVEASAVPMDVDMTASGKIRKKKKSSSRKSKEKDVEVPKTILPDINQKANTVGEWIRTVDESLNVYYYNSYSGASEWLAPCCKCKDTSLKWCIDCSLSYCEKDYLKHHSSESMSTHKTSVKEIVVPDKLQKGELHCVKCKFKVGTLCCTTCWDPYCPPCFPLTHDIGALKRHQTVLHSEARKGWMIIRSYNKDPDFYVNEPLGITTYDMPIEFMNPAEAEYYNNFMFYKSKNEELLGAMEKVLYDLEDARYHRDLLLAEQREDMLAMQAGKKGFKEKSILDGAKNATKPTGFMALFKKDDSEYRELLLSPDDRRRGKERTDYIKKLIGN